VKFSRKSDNEYFENKWYYMKYVGKYLCV